MQLSEFPKGNDAENELSEYDWKAAFDVCDYHNADAPKAVVKPITPEEVAEVTHLSYESGYYAETAIQAVFRLHDGRWAAMDAWCDTTGWGCQAGGEVSIGDSFDEIVRFGMGDAMRDALGIGVPA